MGPVVGQLWNAERSGRIAVAEPATPDEAALNSIGYVVARYGGLSWLDLEHLTHSERPRQEADARRRELQQRTHAIDVQGLREYFVTQARADDDVPVTPEASDVQAWLDDVDVRVRDEPSLDTRESLAARRR